MTNGKNVPHYALFEPRVGQIRVLYSLVRPPQWLYGCIIADPWQQLCSTLHVLSAVRLHRLAGRAANCRGAHHPD